MLPVSTKAFSSCFLLVYRVQDHCARALCSAVPHRDGLCTAAFKQDQRLKVGGGETCLSQITVNSCMFMWTLLTQHSLREDPGKAPTTSVSHTVWITAVPSFHCSNKKALGLSRNGHSHFCCVQDMIILLVFCFPQGPSCWEDVLIPNRMSGECQSPDCPGTRAVSL